MEARFWHLEQLSDQQLLERLQGVLQMKRRALAELIAQLGEVEERRLHLQAACSSLFAYCVQRLGMSEDEACRRIEVARLARKFPALFVELASGRITLSVALLLKRVLSADNHVELLAAVRCASTERARELLAARFPSPDVPSGIRKLPERRTAASQPMNSALPALPAWDPASVAAPLLCSSQSSRAAPPAAMAASSTRELPSSEVVRCDLAQSGTSRQFARSNSGLQQRIEPLSAGRYRVMFTADANLKRKLEQARDLLRHAQPNGDLGAIVSRALDYLLEELMGRRFGKLRKERATKRAAAMQASTPAPVAPATVAPATATAATATSTPTAAAPRPAPLRVDPPASAHIARAARRAVLERDGLRCSWGDADGQRCGSTAWLELDHCHPVGKGGSAEPENLRMLCRAHNRFAAEHAYGRAHVEQAIRDRKRSTAPQRRC
jgi:hypothetical protein